MAANVNNYIAAGRAVAQDNVGFVNALVENKVKYDEIGKASVRQDARNKANAATNNATIAKRKIASEADLQITREAAKRNKDIRGIDKQARMTGMLAGGAALIGIGAMDLNKKEETDPTFGVLSQQMEQYNKRIADAKADIDRLDALGESLDSAKTDYSTDDTSSGNSDSSSNGSSSNGSSSSSSSSSSVGKTNNPISSFQATGKAGKYTVGDMTKLAEQAGFTPEQAKIMGAIGFAESGGNAGIDTVQSGLDPNKSNEYSVGLFQVNAQAHGDKLTKLGYTADDLRDPVKAAKVAKMVYDEVGSFKPWSVYKSGAYSQYLN